MVKKKLVKDLRDIRVSVDLATQLNAISSLVGHIFVLEYVLRTST